VTTCSLCERDLASFRRRLCRSCYRKLSQCGLPLPPRAPSGPVVDVRGWVAQWPENRRREFLAALGVEAP
jgi:predicted amidophosphoribosyltransferase